MVVKLHIISRRYFLCSQTQKTRKDLSSFTRVLSFHGGRNEFNLPISVVL